MITGAGEGERGDFSLASNRLLYPIIPAPFSGNKKVVTLKEFFLRVSSGKRGEVS
jgi:hypothetical protein